MTVEEKLDAVLTKLDRLELIESHLLDLLLPHRRAFMRSPHTEPPRLVHEEVRSCTVLVQALHDKVDAMAQPRTRIVPYIPDVAVNSSSAGNSRIIKPATKRRPRG